MNFEQDFNKYCSERCQSILGMKDIDAVGFSNKYFNSNTAAEISIDPNANVSGISPNNYMSEMAKPFAKKYFFMRLHDEGVKLFGENFSLKHVYDGSIYIHDATKLQPYCFGVSATEIATEGRPYSTLPALPPKRFESFMGQLTEFIMDCSQEFAGAIAITDLVPWIAWFIERGKKDSKYPAYIEYIPETEEEMDLYEEMCSYSDKEIQNIFQSFIHVLNNNFRTGGDSLAYDEELILRKGKNVVIKKIGELCENFEDGYESLSMNPNNGKIEWRKVTNGIVHDNPNKFCIITLGSGKKIDCTVDHSLYSFNDKGQLQITSPSEEPEFVLMPRYIPKQKCEPVWIKFTGHNGRKVLNEKYLLDEDFAWMIGLYTGDGHTDGSTISFSLYNKVLDDEIIRIMTDIFGCTYNIHKGKSDKGYGGDIRFNVGIDVVSWFNETLGNGALNKKAPLDILFKCSRDIQLSYINGIIDSDGNINSKGAEVAVISEQLIDGLRILSSYLGLMTREGVRYFEDKKDFGDYQSEQQQIYRIFFPKEFWQELSPLKAEFPSDVKSHKYPYDYDWIRPLVKKFYKNEISIKSAGSMKITIEMIDEWYKDTKSRLQEIEETDYVDSVIRILIMPRFTSYNGFNYDTRDSYNIKGIDNFNRLKNERIHDLRYLNSVLGYLQHVVPMKIRSIDYNINHAKSYDISVDGNQNFITKNLIIAHNSPFTNISINSKMVYYDIFDHYVFPDGKTIDDLWETIKRVQKIIIDFMGKGRPDGLPYKFPILTANFKSDKAEMESDWFKYVAEKNASGFMNVNFAERFAMCCRLSLDFDFKQNSFGGGGVKVGSMRVANLNLPRIAYQAYSNITKFGLVSGLRGKVITEFNILLRYYIDRAIEYLTAYHEIFKDMVGKGFLKFFRAPSEWFNTNMFFATVGFCGIYDAAEMLIPNSMPVSERDLLDKRVEVMERMIDTMIDKTKGKSNGIKFNVEEVPSESAAGTMAKFNRDFDETKKYYSNQFLPLADDIQMQERIKIEAKLQSKLTGGGMTFLNFDSKLTPRQSYEIHRHMMNIGFTGQFCINYGYSHCKICGTTMLGRHNKVCSCGIPADFYTRVVGYLAKLSDTCSSKASEIEERYNYKSKHLIYTE